MEYHLLWPVRPRPRESELLSSWLQELARGHGLKLQAFCDCVFGKDRQIWNRDIDRLAPPWLLQELSRRTGAAIQTIAATTLDVYRGSLYDVRNISGQLRWILPLQMYHRKHLGYGVQYCSQCLTADKEPYFRTYWRVAYYTFCPTHCSLLRDRCWYCSRSVEFHRRELGKPLVLSAGPMSICHACGYDLRLAMPLPIPVYDCESHQNMVRLLRSVETSHLGTAEFDLGFHAILHQQCRLIVSERSAPRFRDFIRSAIDCPQIAFVSGKFPFERRTLAERHEVLSMAMWIMSNLPERLTAAWRAKVLRYSVLVKDMPRQPSQFARLTRGFNRNWSSPKRRTGGRK